MSAAGLGERLLAEVGEEGLDELLGDLRRFSDSQPRGVLGLSQLDHLLEIFCYPILPQTAQDSRWTSPPHRVDEGTSPSSVGNITFAPGTMVMSQLQGRTRPAVIQLTNNKSAGGKTSLCYLLTALAVLPLDCGGKEHEVVWFDTDGRFSAMRLQSVLMNNLTSNFPELSPCQSKAISREALRHVHVFRPQSSSQLVLTLASLPGYLLQTVGSTAHSSASRKLGLIVLDSATAFQWQDRFEADIARFEALRTGQDAGTRSLPRSSKTLKVTAELKKLLKLFDCTIVFTSAPYARSSIKETSAGSAVPASQWRLLPQDSSPISPWAAFATLNLSLSHDHIRQFTAQMSLEKCQGDQMNRLAVVAKGRSIVSVDRSTSDTWAPGVRDALHRLDRQGSFALSITPSGITVEE